MRIRIDKFINASEMKNRVIKQISFLYGINPSKVFIDSMNNVSAYYVEDLNKDSNIIMQSRQSEIAFDKMFFKFNSDGSIIGLEPSLQNLFYSQFIHELLHNASRNNGYSGIETNSSNRLALNEGLTQMFTEDISGKVVSKFTDGYREYKKIAKIMKVTFGVLPIYNTYFNHTNDLEKLCDKLSNTYGYYQSLNNEMSKICKLGSKIKKNGKTLVYADLMSKYTDGLYDNVIINIIIPKLKSLNPETKKAYIKNILLSVSDDNDKENKIKATISKYMNLSNDQLEKEKDRLKHDTNKLNSDYTFINILNEKPDVLSEMIFVSQDGSVKQLNNKSQNIENNEVLSKVYEFLGKKRYKFPKTEINKYIKILQSGQDLVIHSDSILERRKIFECIKSYLVLEGYYILNDFTELDNSSVLKNTTFIRLNENKILSFSDLKKVCNKFGIVKSKKKNDDRYDVYDRITGKIVTNMNIKKIAQFANAWLYSAQTSISANEKIPEMQSAFSKENEIAYNTILEFVSNNLYKTGNLNISRLYSISDRKISDIVKKLFSSPMLYEWTFAFINLQLNGNVLQFEKEKSLSEINDKDYLIKCISHDANAILNH